MKNNFYNIKDNWYKEFDNTWNTIQNDYNNINGVAYDYYSLVNSDKINNIQGNMYKDNAVHNN